MNINLIENQIEQNQSERTLLYARYFAKIPRYLKNMKYVLKMPKILSRFNRATKAIHDHHPDTQLRHPIVDKPLLYLTYTLIAYSIYKDYKIISSNRTLTIKENITFLIDKLCWFYLASFFFPKMIFGKTVNLFVNTSGRYIRNNIVHTRVCVLFSLAMIFFSMNPIDRLSTFILDNTYRKYVSC